MSGTIGAYPIVQVTVSARESADDKRLREILARIASQDLAVSITTEGSGTSYFIEGNSRSHLQSICEELRDEYHLPIHVGTFKAVLLETIREAVEAEGKYIRQVGGVGNYGHCKLHVDPNEFGEGCQFASAVRDDVLPCEYVDSIRRGVERKILLGVRPGRHLADLKVTVIDGSYHADDSNPAPFEMAGVLAFENALKRASTVLLEPVMLVEIEVPEDSARTAENRINEHRGRIERIEAENGRSKIRAIVPVAELLLPGSRELAEFPSSFFGYEPISDDGDPGENGPAVTANKPNSPRYRKGSAATRPDSEEG